MRSLIKTKVAKNETQKRPVRGFNDFRIRSFFKKIRVLRVAGFRPDSFFFKIGTGFSTKFWLNFDLGGITCASIAIGIIIYSQLVVTIFITRPWGNPTPASVINTIIFNLLAELAKISHWRAMTTDPGSVPKEAIPVGGPNHWTAEWELSHETSESWNYGGGADVRPLRKVCRRCMGYKPPRAHHCSQCKRCIIKMDHHCPWINNCVGLNNHKFFLLFLLYVNLLCIYTLPLGIYYLFEHCTKESGCETKKIPVLLTMGLLVFATLFAMFTLCMMCDQYDAITSGTTQIDRLKGEVHESQDQVNEVCGGRNARCRFVWLIPIRATFPNESLASIYGFALKNLRPESIEDSGGSTNEIERLSLNRQFSPKSSSFDDEELFAEPPASLFAKANKKLHPEQTSIPSRSRHVSPVSTKRRVRELSIDSNEILLNDSYGVDYEDPHSNTTVALV